MFRLRSILLCMNLFYFRCLIVSRPLQSFQLWNFPCPPNSCPLLDRNALFSTLLLKHKEKQVFNITCVNTSFPSSCRLLSARDWSRNSDSYIGIVNSISVDMRRSTFGDQMWSVIHVWDRSHSSHIQACWDIIKQHQKHVTQSNHFWNVTEGILLKKFGIAVWVMTSSRLVRGYQLF